MELMTNNLTAMVNGSELTLHQKAAAKMEYLKLLETIQILETKVENLNLHGVSQQRELLAIAALDKIAHPIKYLQSEAEKEGAKLDGYMAIQITQDANFYQEIADKALKAIANCG